MLLPTGLQETAAPTITDLASPTILVQDIPLPQASFTPPASPRAAVPKPVAAQFGVPSDDSTGSELLVLCLATVPVVVFLSDHLTFYVGVRLY